MKSIPKHSRSILFYHTLYSAIKIYHVNFYEINVVDGFPLIYINTITISSLIYLRARRTTGLPPMITSHRM